MRIYIPLSLAACLTAACAVPVTPEIEIFAARVQTASELASAEFSASDLDARIAEEKRNDMLRQGAQYSRPLTKEGDVIDCVEPDLAELNPVGSAIKPAPDFLQSCAIKAYSIANGELTEIVPAVARVEISQITSSEDLTPVQWLRLEMNARRSSEALSDYAAALKDLAVSDSPQAVGAAATSALTALSNAAAAGAEASGNPISPGVQTVISTGASLIGQITREALEAKRYQLLLEIVRGADPTVRELSYSTAGWYYFTEEPQISEKFSIVRQLLGAPAKSENELMAIETALANAKVTDEGAKWRTFWAAAVAHHFILESLSKPADGAALLAANQRIADLVTSTKAFVSAIKNVKGN